MGRARPISARQLLDAHWAACGHVRTAAKSIGLGQSAYYERLAALGVSPTITRTLRETGKLLLAGESGMHEYEPSPGTVRIVEPESGTVPPFRQSAADHVQSGGDVHSLGSNTTMATAAAARPSRDILVWRPRPNKTTVIAFRQAQLDLAKAGKEPVSEDELLDLMAESIHFQHFVAELVELFRRKP